MFSICRRRTAICSVLTVFAFALYCSDVSAQIIYSNGNISTGVTSRSGVVSPAGSTWSEISHDFGSTTETNTTLGFGCQRIGAATNNRCADDFDVPVGQTWTINSIVTYAYQTGFAGATSPVVAANVQIWNGRPGDPGAVVVAGNATSLPFTSTDILIYRTSNSGPPLNTVPGTTRRIWENTITLGAPAVLTAGKYWVDFQTDTGATTGNFTPPVTITGTRTVAGWNGRQFTTAWADALDAGNPATASDEKQEFPFKLVGSVGGAPLAPRSRALDFDGDNKTDFAVARSASVSGQTTWWIQKSSGGIIGSDWGLGVGFGGGDKATPADFDGDGKTDIAVWRPGAANVASFYILNSSNSTVRIEPFGLTGDDSAIAGDYDGDGKADPAVYRVGATPGAQSTFFYRGSLNNPSGNTTYAPFGLNGDVAIPGDFDGDGKFDFGVARNEGGLLVHYRLRSTAGFGVFQYGLVNDKILTGDFDADGRTDIAAVRTNGANYDWYVLRSSDTVTVFKQFGSPTTDYLVPGDYDGDNKTDFAVWRSGQTPDQTYFFVHSTFLSPVVFEWGQSAGANTAPDYPVANFAVK